MEITSSQGVPFKSISERHPGISGKRRIIPKETAD